MNIEQDELDRLVDTFVVANTPIYLYKHFRDNPTVRRMAHETPPSDLMRTYNDIAKKTQRTPEEAAQGYAALIALTLCEYDVANHLLSELRSYRPRLGKPHSSVIQCSAIFSEHAVAWRSTNAARTR